MRIMLYHIFISVQLQETEPLKGGCFALHKDITEYHKYKLEI